MAICDFVHNNPGITGGAMLANDFIKLPYIYNESRPPNSASWGQEHKNFQRKNYKRNASVRGPVQEMPNFKSRVEVSSEVSNHWRIPVAKISGFKLDEDIKTAHFIADKAEKWLQAAGAAIPKKHSWYGSYWKPASIGNLQDGERSKNNGHQ